MRLKNLLLTLLVAFVAMPLAAQLQHGKIYRFVNKANTNIAMEASSTTDIYGTTKSERFSHLWLAETHPNNSGAWSLRSLGNGLYVTPKGTSTMWTFSAKPSSSTVLYCINTTGNYYTFNTANHASNSNCMHYATSQGGAIVGWNTGADATHWTIEEVAVDEAELQANWDELNAFNAALTDEFIAQCETVLANLFTDKACTTLKKNFANVAALEADADYKALPTELQEMTKKVYTGNWQENNFDSSKPYWDSEHAKRFRIQSIEPYSIAGEVTEAFGINAHINMDNPLGITGNYRQHVYVIVEGEIKNGAELYLGSLTGHGLLSTYEHGIRLHEGLNVIPFHANGNTLYINYVVHTYQNGKFTNSLDNYSNLKVHIAGGNVNGFYNAVGDHIWGEPDDDDDWQYYEDRTNTESATLLGKRQILHFTMWPTTVTDEGKTFVENNCMSMYLPDNVKVPAGTPAKQKVNKVMEAWDRIHLSELATMGLLSKAEMDSLNNLYPRPGKDWKPAGNIYDYTEEMYNKQNGLDYSKYFNHHGIALGNFSGYMSGGWRNCNYNQNTMNSIIGAIASEAGSTWGPAHEIGHQHQSVFTVNGLTEVTNNVHSNIAVWYMGMGTSRVNGTEGNLANVYDNFKKGNHYLFHAHSSGSQNLWTQTQMYYRLWMYYHLTGHKTDFFPTLFELNRRNRLSSNSLGWIDGKGHTSGTESMLKYYKQACDAAGEDLTEFFRAHGFFALMTQKERGDYSTSYYTQTQKEVDAAIAYVKAKGYRENLAPLFINDCVAKTTYSHDGKTNRSYWDPESANGQNAKIGMYTDFIGESAKAEGYLYKLSGTTLTILYDNASGAVGFIVYDGDELVAFTSNYSVSLPVTATDVKVYAVQADGSKVAMKSAAEGGNEEQQLSALTSAISAATSLLANTTSTGKEVGYYYDEEAAYLRELKAKGEAAKKNADQSEHTYGEWAMLINNEISRLRTDASAFVRIKEGNTYRITNSASKSYRLSFYNGGLKGTSNAEVAAANTNCHWEFVSTGVENEFYMKNVGSGLFITTIGVDENATITSPNSVGSAKFTVRYSDGKINFMAAGNQSNSICMGTSNAIVGKDATNAKAYWMVAMIEDNASEAEKAELENLIIKAGYVLSELEDKNYITTYADNIAELAAALKSAKENAEANVETTINYSKYIDAINKAIADLEGTYVLTPKSSHKDQIHWYHIKNIDKNVYLCANEKDCDATSEIDAENKGYLWAFVATAEEGVFQVYNAKNQTYLYTGTTSRSLLTTDGAADATGYSITVNDDNKALVLSNDEKNWYNQNGVIRMYRTASYWRLEYAGSEAGSLTSIEEIGADNVVEGVYDLTGRRIETITEAGIYIVNGKKTVIK